MPTDRYGRRTSPSTRLLLALAAVTALAVTGWFIWAMIWAADPKVTSSIGTQNLDGNTHVSFDYTVRIAAGVNVADVRCTVTAQAKDFTTVGGPTEITPPSNGSHSYTLRTSRHAVYINWAGCTAPGQTNPR